MATATARFSSTIGEGETCPRIWYSVAMLALDKKSIPEKLITPTYVVTKENAGDWIKAGAVVHLFDDGTPLAHARLGRRIARSIHVALVRGRIALARGEHPRAVEIADTILDQLRRLEVRHLAADALLLKGRSLASGGKADEAKRVLGEARSEAESREYRRVLWEVLRELSEILEGIELLPLPAGIELPPEDGETFAIRCTGTWAGESANAQPLERETPKAEAFCRAIRRSSW